MKKSFFCCAFLTLFLFGSLPAVASTLQRAQELVESGDGIGAARIAESVVNDSSASSQERALAANLLASIYNRRGDLERALRSAQKSIDFAPERTGLVQANQTFIYFSSREKGDLDGARQALLDCIAIDESSEGAAACDFFLEVHRVTLGELTYQGSRLEEMSQDISASAELTQTLRNFSRASSALSHAGHYDESAAFARRVLEAGAEGGEVYYLAQAHQTLADAEINDENYDLATAHLEAGLQLIEEGTDQSSLQTELHLQRARILFLTEQADKAQPLLDELLSSLDLGQQTSLRARAHSLQCSYGALENLDSCKTSADFFWQVGDIRSASLITFSHAIRLHNADRSSEALQVINNINLAIEDIPLDHSSMQSMAVNVFHGRCLLHLETEHRRAADRCEEGIELFTRLLPELAQENQEELAYLHYYAGVAASQRNQRDRAAGHLRLSADLSRSGSNPDFRLNALSFDKLSEVYASHRSTRSRVAPTLKIAVQTMGYLIEPGADNDLVDTYLYLNRKYVGALLESGQNSLAAREARTLAEKARVHNHITIGASAVKLLAIAQWNGGDHNAARSSMNRALQLNEHVDDEEIAAHIRAVAQSMR